MTAFIHGRILARIRGKNLLGPAVLGLLAAGGGAFVGFGRVWARGTAIAPGLPETPVSVTGSSAHGAAAALALVVAASGLGVLAASPRMRRVIGVVSAACACGALVLVLTGGAAMRSARTGADADVTGSVNVWHVTAWPSVTIAALALAVAVSLVVAMSGPYWATMGSRYDSPSSKPDTAAPDDPWSMLDRGDDPTV